jgi:hypothetical protein
MTSNTGEKLEKPGVFKKGYDPRRNLRGVPKEAIKARHLLRKIAAELIQMPNSGEEMTRVEAMLRVMFSSKAPADRQNLLKALWPGLLKDEIDLTTGGDKIVVKLVKDEDGN